jgi:hypothetical protein
MRISTRVEFVWDKIKRQYVKTFEEGFDVDGDTTIALCKGASAGETAVATQQQNLGSTLGQDYGTTFGEQQGTLQNLTNSLTSTLKAGPGQYGFSAPEDTALRTQADSGTAASYQAAKQATGEASAAQGGGNAVLPSGEAGALNAQNANAAAAQQSSQQLGITNAGYQQGEQNYQNAEQGLDTVSQIENPNSYASNANSANSGAFSSQNTITQQNNAANPWNIGLGLLGGAVDAGLSGGGVAGLAGLFGGAKGSGAVGLGAAQSNSAAGSASLSTEGYNPDIQI